MDVTVVLDPLEMHIAVTERALKDIARERDIYRKALQKIANDDFGGYLGGIAYQAFLDAQKAAES